MAKTTANQHRLKTAPCDAPPAPPQTPQPLQPSSVPRTRPPEPAAGAFAPAVKIVAAFGHQVD